MRTAPSRRRTYTQDNDTDARLWALVAQIQGKPVDEPVADPFGELYRATRPTVFRFIRGKVDGHHTAEDLTSDVYERAGRRIGRLERATSSPAAWLVTIARHMVADHHRKSYARPCRLVEEISVLTPGVRPESVHAPDVTAQAVIDAEDAARTARDAELLLAAVSRLTDKQAAVVRLRYLHGMSIVATAGELGQEIAVVKSLTYRAVRVLARDPELACLAAAGRSD